MSASGDAPVRAARILIVAGHDPSGAGIDADRAALEAARVHGPLDVACVVTARTDQDARAVRAIGARDPVEWLREARAHAARGVDAIKFGLLPGHEHVRAACELVRVAAARFVVLDPVLSASSGGRFLDARGVTTLVESLLPLDVIVTPNVPELAELVGAVEGSRTTFDAAGTLARDLAARRAAAERLLATGARAVVAKGGHGQEDPVADLMLARGEPCATHTHPRVVGGKVRGSGCRFASFLAARLAQGRPLGVAAAEARGHVVGLLVGP